MPPILFAQIESGFELSHFRNSSGSLAIFAAIRRVERFT
jgi:hypothetical protein